MGNKKLLKYIGNVVLVIALLAAVVTLNVAVQKNTSSARDSKIKTDQKTKLNVAVVNEKICLYLAGEMVVIFDLLFRIIFVNGVKLDTALTTPVYGVLKELSFSYAPKNELVVFFNEHL